MEKQIKMTCNSYYMNMIFLFVAVLAFISCERVDSNFLDDNTEKDDGSVRVAFKIANIEQMSFENTTSRAALSTLCSRFTVAVFQNDTKVNAINQTSEDEGFGTISMSLQPGAYKLVAIAHNGLGNCTVSSPDKITFYNNKLTDTFFCYDSLTVSEATTRSINLKRAVSMYRLCITDNMPSSVSQMKFYYTGGSSTFDAVTGFGCVNSRQTEIFTLSSDYYGKPSTFEVYSFPHAETDSLDMTVTALDASGNTISENTYSNIPIKQNVITQHTDAFFTGLSGSSALKGSFSIENDGQWGGTINN